jgi:hypothetical protein
VLIRSDSGGGIHDYLPWLTKPSRRHTCRQGIDVCSPAYVPERVVCDLDTMGRGCEA